MSAAVRTHFRRQAEACRRLGSPLYATLLEHAAVRLDERSAVGRAVLGWPGAPNPDALALRFAGGLHALVLSGRAPDLAAAYAAGEAAPAARLWPAVEAALAADAATVLAFLQQPPQTNEVARAALLAGGYLTVAARTGLPLAMLEIGASAGLNLHWDRYRHRFGEAAWGPPAAGLELAPAWEGPAPPLPAVAIAARAGCDRAPLDSAAPADRLRLRAYVWPDQPQRLARLDAALAQAAASGLQVEQADAGAWCEQRLARLPAGCATVLCHSIVWGYLPPATQARLRAGIAAAAAQAGPDAAFAWLRMEPAKGHRHAELRLDLWPGGQVWQLADADFHGRWIRWHGAA